MPDETIRLRRSTHHHVRRLMHSHISGLVHLLILWRVLLGLLLLLVLSNVLRGTMVHVLGHGLRHLVTRLWWTAADELLLQMRRHDLLLFLMHRLMVVDLTVIHVVHHAIRPNLLVVVHLRHLLAHGIERA